MRLVTITVAAAGAGGACAFTHSHHTVQQLNSSHRRRTIGARSLDTITITTTAPCRRHKRPLSMQNMGFPPLPDPFPPKRDGGPALQPGEVAVRFIGTEDGEDKVIAARPGDAITAVAQRAGVKIATSCRSGLCGTCTTDLEDPNWPTKKTYRPGYQPIRACVGKIGVPTGCEEMVLDVYRGSAAGRKLNKNLIPDDIAEGLTLAAADLPDAMSRFGDNWENDFKPDYKIRAQAAAAANTRGGAAAALQPDAANGLASSGSSKVRRQVLDGFMGGRPVTQRFQPDAPPLVSARERLRAQTEAAQAAATAAAAAGSLPPAGAPLQRSAPSATADAASTGPITEEDTVPSPYSQPLGEVVDVEPPRRERAHGAAANPDIGRNVGVSALRADAYQNAALPRVQARHPRDTVDNASGDDSGGAGAGQIRTHASARAGTWSSSGGSMSGSGGGASGMAEGWDESADVFSRDFSGPVRATLQSNRIAALDAADAAAADADAINAAIERDNYAPDFSRRQRGRLHAAVNEEAPWRDSSSGDAWSADDETHMDAHTGAPLPYGVKVGTGVSTAPAVRRSADGGLARAPCNACGAAGMVTCYQCQGAGQLVEEGYVVAEDGSRGVVTRQCYLCMGSGRIRCSNCQGTGMRLG